MKISEYNLQVAWHKVSLNYVKMQGMNCMKAINFFNDGKKNNDTENQTFYLHQCLSTLYIKPFLSLYKERNLWLFLFILFEVQDTDIETFTVIEGFAPYDLCHKNRNKYKGKSLHLFLVYYKVTNLNPISE